MRQIVLDTETTGLEPSQGHKIIEIGCVELLNRKLTKNNFHVYINPQREIDDGAIEVHGITNEFLEDKLLFKDIARDFLEYVKDAELIIHNAPFDIGFLDHELKQLDEDLGKMSDYCSVVDSLVLARSKHPGQKNNLDALCKRYEIDNSHRELHGALLDSEILADVFLLMTGGQRDLGWEGEDETDYGPSTEKLKKLSGNNVDLKVISASSEELQSHENLLGKLAEQSETVIWHRKPEEISSS